MAPTQPPLPPAARDRYLARIGYVGALSPDIEVLRALHRAHLLAIPYENLDIHLGRTLTLDPHAIFEKLVVDRRGGWCYEMNGLFGRVLESLGFEVRYLSGAVGRVTRGESAEGNHLVLLVTLDRPWIVDVGFGDGFLEPLPLEQGDYRQGFLDFRVMQVDERWVVYSHEYSGADSFDFTLEPRVLADFSHQSHELQTSPASGFVQTTVCQRFVEDGIVTLRGAVLRHVTVHGVTARTIERADEYVDLLRDEFGLAPRGAAALFPRVWARHQEWLAAP